MKIKKLSRMSTFIIFIYISYKIISNDKFKTSRILQESSHSTNSNETLIIYFIIISLLIGAISREIKNAFKIPYSPLWLIFGFIFGLIAHYLFELGDALILVNNIDPHGILYIFIPALVYESAANSDSFTFKRELGQVLILAGPGVLIGTSFLAVVLKIFLNYTELTWLECFTLASIISATDPVAVVALLNDLGTNIGFKILLEGESLWNDGTAMVIYTIFSSLVLGENLSGWDIFLKFLQLTFGGILFGVFISFILTFWLEKIIKDDIHTANLTVVFCYLTFFISEFYLKVSGILSIVTLGMIMANKGKLKINQESEAPLHYIWSYLQYFMETVLFFFTGTFIGINILQKTNVITAVDIAKVIGFFFFMILARFLMLLILWPIINLLGNKINFKDIIILTYGGLRGAIGLSLGLLILTNTNFRFQFRELSIFYITVVIFLTVLVNGLTIKHLIRLIGFQKKSALKLEIKNNILIKLLIEGFNMKTKIKESRFLQLVSWNKVYENCGFFNIVNFIEKEKLKIKKQKQKIVPLDVLEIEKNSKLHELNLNKDKINNGNLNENYKENKFDIEENKNYLTNLDPKEYGKNSCDINEIASPFPRKTSMFEKLKNRVNHRELLIEGRIRFYNLIKNQVWEFYEQNLCSANTAKILSDLVNYCLENPKKDIWLWEILNKTNYSFIFLHKILKYSRIRFIGYFFRKYLFNILLNKYEKIYILIKVIKKVQDEEIDIPIEVNILVIINEEIKILLNNCEYYLFNLKDEFKSIIQVVQEKRASIIILNHMKHVVDYYKNIGIISNDEFISSRKNINKRIKNLKTKTHDYDKLKNICKFSLISGSLGKLSEENINLIEKNSKKLDHAANDVIQKDDDDNIEGIHIITEGIVEEYISLKRYQKIGIGYPISFSSYINKEKKTIGLYKALNNVETVFIPKFVIDTIYKNSFSFREKIYRSSTLYLIERKNKELSEKFGNKIYDKIRKSDYLEYKKDIVFQNINGIYIFEGTLINIETEKEYKAYSYIETNDKNYKVMSDSKLLLFHKEKSIKRNANKRVTKKIIANEGQKIKMFETTYEEQYKIIKEKLKSN